MSSEEQRVIAEEGRVKAEAERAHAESNDGTGRVEAEQGRVSAEELRVAAQTEYIAELQKLQDDPEHYITPGARRVFRKYTYAWIILAFAVVVGVWALTNEANNRVEDINKNRAIITYTTCLDQNDRHDLTVERLDALVERRTAQIRTQLTSEPPPSAEEAQALRAEIDRVRASRDSTVSLIEALAPHQNCEQLVIDRFGSLPEDTQNLGGE